nr:NAD-dependent epimerase/dehydratase family protein [Anaerolineae bacterium]
MRVLVLGATGFIGGQIARAAHHTGMDVHCLRRREGAVGAVGDIPLTWHSGDLDDAGSLSAAMHGCDCVFHAAAYYPFTDYNVRKAASYSVRQIRCVFQAAREAGVSRLVYTSSLTTIGTPPTGEGRPADERDGYIPGSTANPYYEAKWAMEHEALRANQSGLPVMILCPTAVFGPGDVKPSTSEILLMVAKQQMPAAVDVTANMVDGRDVALAHVRAATLGNPGERYIIGGHNLNVSDALRTAAGIAGVKAPRLILSVKAVARLLSVAQAFRLPIPATMRGLPYWQPMNCEKGWQTFGIVPRPFEDTVRDTLAWFRENGYLKK